MAAENGILTIAFTKKGDNPSVLTKFISEKLSVLESSGQYLKNEVCDWSFMDGWNAGRCELSSQLVTYDSIDCVKAFCKEIISLFPELGFGGSLYHDWVNSESAPTQITFMHKNGSNTLLWQSKRWDSDTLMEAMDGEGEPGGWSGIIDDLPATRIDHWMWDTKTEKVKKLEVDADLNYYAEFLRQR